MKSLHPISICFLFFLFACGSEQVKEVHDTTPLTPLSNTHKQIVVVVSPSDTSTTGTLYKYTWANTKWNMGGRPYVVNLGRSGLDWGVGSYPALSHKSKGKVEGDGKSPAGIFDLTTIFGYEHKDSLSIDISMPYIQASEVLECVDDGKSAHYNQLVNNEELEKDWNSSEQMRREDDVYKWGVVVAHNSNLPVSGLGSCIFLHVWFGEGVPTSGCTAMRENLLVDLLKWLDSSKKPILIQMTKADYTIFQKRYALPVI